MFGTQRDFENRLVEYRSSLTGIKHLHRLKAPSAYASRPPTESSDHASSDDRWWYRLRFGSLLAEYRRERNHI